MRVKLVYSAAVLLLAFVSTRANADTVNFTFAGGGTSGTIALTYGPATDSKYPQGFEGTGIGGTFTDTNIGIVNASIIGLVAINHASPEPTNLLAPNDFSKFAVASGLPPQANGVLTYDNLFYPDGSPQTATDYPFHGGFLDIYGLLFDLGNGDVVDLWSNGVTRGATTPDYGVAVATSAQSLDYVGNGIAATPEPGTLCLIGTGLLGVVLRRRPSFLWMPS